MADLFSSTSRFKLTEPIEFNGHLTVGLMKKFNFLDRTKIDEADILQIEVQNDRAGRPDLIAEDIYGTTLFKWVLLLFNNATNPLAGWPQGSTVIEAPSRDAVWREL
jgi:hypothetical protein